MTLVRFDVVYCSLFKCNLRRLTNYPRLSAFLEKVAKIPEARQTGNIERIKRNYYSNYALNSNGIVPPWSRADLARNGLGVSEAIRSSVVGPWL